MATTLTLHQGQAEAAFQEHPTEVARRALREAAQFEWESGTDDGMQWAGILTRFVNVLPHREPVRGGE